MFLVGVPTLTNQNPDLREVLRRWRQEQVLGELAVLLGSQLTLLFVVLARLVDQVDPVLVAVWLLEGTRQSGRPLVGSHELVVEVQKN